MCCIPRHTRRPSAPSAPHALSLPLQELYWTAKQLADAVIPNEYGLDPKGKLRIGSKVTSVTPVLHGAMLERSLRCD